MLFSFLFGLGLLRNGVLERRGYTVRPISLYMLLFGREHKHTGRHILFLQALVGWARRHIHMDVPVRENMGGRNMVTWRSGERRSWIDSAQATAEMNSEWCSVCMPLDLISPTCPCHSDSQAR